MLPLEIEIIKKKKYFQFLNQRKERQLIFREKMGLATY